MANLIDVYVYRLVEDPASGQGFYRVDSVTRQGLPTANAKADAANVQFAAFQAPGTPIYSRLEYSIGGSTGANLQTAYFIDSLATLLGKINA